MRTHKATAAPMFTLAALLALGACQQVPSGAEAESGIDVLAAEPSSRSGGAGTSGSGLVTAPDDANAVALPGAGNVTVGTGITYATATSEAPSNLRDSTLQSWADVAAQQLQLQFWTPANAYFTTTWAMAQALDTLALQAQRTAGTHGMGPADSVFTQLSSLPYSPGAPVAYDTQAWLVLAELQLYRAARGLPAWAGRAPAYLADANARLAVVLAGEDVDARGTSRGMFKAADKTSKATTSNAAAVLAACQMYAVSRDPGLLAQAQRIYDAWYAVAVDANGRVGDTLTGAATRASGADYTLNAGIMVGAAAALHRATGQSAYLAQARRMAAQLQGTFTQSTAAGNVLYEPSCDPSCANDQLLYKGIAMRHLVDLVELDPGQADLQNLLNRTARSLWTSARDGGNTLGPSWVGPPAGAPSFWAHLAGAQALGALANTDRVHRMADTLPNVLEAEEGTVSYLGGPGNLESNYPPFGGFGFVGHWEGAGQAVTLRQALPYGGAYALGLRYGNGGGDTARTIDINGARASTLTLPGTGDWAIWRSVALSPNIAAGAATVAIALPAGQSSGAANLDTVTLWPAAAAGCRLPSAPNALQPTQEQSACGAPSFVWSGDGSAVGYDVVLDGAVACSSVGTSCTPAQVPAAGRHNWYVVAKASCGSTPGSVMTVRTAAARPSTPILDVRSSAAPPQLTVAWQAQGSELDVAYDVSLNGALICSQLRGTSCTVAAPALVAPGNNAVVVTARNACGLTASAAAVL